MEVPAMSKASVSMAKALRIQVIFSLLLSTVLSIYNGIIGYSVLLGGLIYSLPTGLAMKREFAASVKTMHHSKQILIWMYSNELLKLGLTLVLFIMVFGLLRPIHSPALLGTYISSHILSALFISVYV
jgi:ATP synthase protein I